MQNKEHVLLELLKNPGIVRDKHMPEFFKRIGEDSNLFFEMHVSKVPLSHVVHQHVNNVDDHLAFIRDVKSPFRKVLIKDINCLRNLKNKDKHEIGDMITAKAHSFCISNVQKCKWLITKFI